MPKYHIGLRVNFNYEAGNLAAAVARVISILNENFTNLRGLELTGLWEVEEKQMNLPKSLASEDIPGIR